MAKLNTDYYQGTDRYSDGDVEERILELVREGKGADETQDRSFPVLYHLSPVREGILSWYPFREGTRVLDIGAGPGAITGLLCRRCAQVTTVDISLRRSRINYERHKEFDNLTVMVGNLNDMVFPEAFDYVILNGAFEYAGSFTEGEDPYGSFLKRCLSYLKEDGVLLVAIENRLGLKYFSGAPEDHTDNYMEGLKNYPDNTAVRTFSKAQWEALAARCGLKQISFYYPYPDYKFPVEIFTDRSLTPDRFRRNAWNFNPRRVELFPEAQMAAALAGEGVMDRFMNSFLIEMCREKQPEGERITFARVNYDRSPFCRIQTVIGTKPGTEQERFVRRSALSGEAKDHLAGMCSREQEIDQTLSHAALSFRGKELRVHMLQGALQEDGSVLYPFLTGESLGRITARAAEDSDAETIREAVRLLEALIRLSAGREKETANAQSGSDLQKDRLKFVDVFGPANPERAYETVCPANIDLIFDNLILEEETLFVLDAEWVFDFPVPADFILWRAIHELYADQPRLEQVLPREVLFAECKISARDQQLFWKWASHFEKHYVGANRLAEYAQPVRSVDLNAAQLSGEKANLTATLYLDRGQGFCEEDAVHCAVVLQRGGYDVTFEIEHTETVRSIRFDPFEGVPGVCDLSSKEVRLEPLNSSAGSAKGCEFLTQDPAYAVHWKERAPERIRITGRVQLHDLAWALGRSQAHLRRTPGGALRALKRRISERR